MKKHVFLFLMKILINKESYMLFALLSGAWRGDGLPIAVFLVVVPELVVVARELRFSQSTADDDSIIHDV